MVGNVLNTKVVREIKNNFKTYVSVILIATLAVTLFTGIYANYKNFDERLDHIYQEANMCDGIVMTKSYNETIEAYLNEKSIVYEKRIYMLGSHQNLELYLASFDQASILNQPYEYSLDTRIQANMVFVDEKFMQRTNLKIGDRFEVSIPFPALNVSLQITLPISATMTHPESLENSTYCPSFVYVGMDALREAIYTAYPFLSKDSIDSVLSNQYNQFLISGNKTIFQDIKNEFSDNENFIYSLKREELPSNMTVDADVEQAKQLIYIFPVIFYLVAVLIILTSISQLITREGKNIGILKALGFSKKEILFHYMKIFIVLSVLGSIFGILLGPIIVPNVMGNKYNILYQLPKISLPFFRLEYLYSVVILICITALTSIFACYEVMHQVPASCLCGENAVKLKISFLNRFKLFRRLPLPLVMAFRNMKRKWSRTLMVILGVLGCSALLVCGFGIEDTINYGLDLEIEELIPYDVSATYSSPDIKKEEFMKIDHIASVDEYAKYSISIEKKKLISSYLFLLPKEANVFGIDYNKDSCILSRRVAEEIDAKKGDEIRFIYGSKRYTIVVTDVVDFCLSQGIFISEDHYEDILYIPEYCWIQSTDKQYNEVIASKIKQIDGILSSQSVAEMRAHADDVISSIKVMTWTIKIFAILLAVVVIYNLALLNFKERIKDIATLKVLGFSHFEVAVSFIIEILCLTFIGGLIGLAFVYPLMVAVLSINENPLISYIYHVQPQSYSFTILITCGSSLIINLIFAYLTRKVQMVESLKSVE